MNKKEVEIVEEYFKIYKTDTDYELESYTNGGVDMFIIIDKKENLIPQLDQLLDDNSKVSDDEVVLYE